MKFLSIFISLNVLVSLIFPPATAGKIRQPPVQSPSVILVEQRSGQVLWERNADERRPVASLTKIMTALLVLEKLGLSQKVIFSQAAAQASSDKIKYKVGDERSSEELLYSLLMLSANNAAAALAEKIGGSQEVFVQMMNLKAAQLGAVNTAFANPHGLPAAQPQYSTARDLAIIAVQAMKHPVFRKIVASRDYDFVITGESSKKIENTNELLKVYPEATGIKTGYTREAGYCLVASARRGGLSLIAVILGSDSRAQSFADAKELFEYGFNNFSYRQLVVENRTYARVIVSKSNNNRVKLVADKDVSLLVYDQPASIKYRTVIKNGSRSNIRRGDRLGKLVVSQFGKELAQVDLVAADDIEATSTKKPVKKGWLMDSLRGLLSLFGL